MVSARATRVSIIVAVIALMLLPIWGVPRLVTQDGSSHVYNAALAVWVQTGRAPFDSVFTVKSGIQPNVASHAALELLGATLGWALAERLVLTLAVLATFVAVVMTAPGGEVFVVTGGWLASSWFVWMGFYDFALSIPCFVLLLVALRTVSGDRRQLLLFVALALLFLTHIFTFAVGVGIATVAAIWDARIRGESRRDLRILIPSFLVLAVEVLAGGAAAGGMHWTDGLGARLADLLFGDFVMALRYPDGLAGIAIVVALAASVVARVRARDSKPGKIGGVELCGIGLIVVSLFMPDIIGQGGYVPVRLRYLGALVLVPSLALYVRRLPPVATRIATGVLLTAFALRGAWMVRDTRVVNAEQATVSKLLAEAGAANGSWIVSRMSGGDRRWPARVGVYAHLAEGVATGSGMAVLNNYEALNDIFFVGWRGRPDWIAFQAEGDTLRARFLPGQIALPEPFYVLHDSRRPVAPADSSVETVRTVADGRFAITVVRGLQPRGQSR